MIAIEQRDLQEERGTIRISPCVPSRGCNDCLGEIELAAFPADSLPQSRAVAKRELDLNYREREKFIVLR